MCLCVNHEKMRKVTPDLRRLAHSYYMTVYQVSAAPTSAPEVKNILSFLSNDALAWFPVGRRREVSEG
jgi:hypothetical protein